MSRKTLGIRGLNAGRWMKDQVPRFLLGNIWKKKCVVRQRKVRKQIPGRVVNPKGRTVTQPTREEVMSHFMNE